MKNSFNRGVLRQMMDPTTAPPPRSKVREVLKRAKDTGLNVDLDIHGKDFGKISADLLNPKNWTERDRPADTIASAKDLDNARRQRAMRKDEPSTTDLINLPNDLDA